MVFNAPLSGVPLQVRVNVAASRSQPIELAWSAFRGRFSLGLTGPMKSEQGLN
jgi:hypothetical protein